jgi:hypothetical protein
MVYPECEELSLYKNIMKVGGTCFMATEKTIFNNVVTDDETNAGVNNTKYPIEYGQDFDGTEELQWQPESFEAFGKTTRIDSAELASKICAHFKQTFHELKGCNLIAHPGNQIAVELYFERNTEECPRDKIMNLESLIDGSSKNLFHRQQAVNNRREGKTFTLNNETKLLLSKFMFGGKNVNLPNSKVWTRDDTIREIHIPVQSSYYKGYNAERILIRVSNLDIRKILQEMYGYDIVTKTVANENADMNFRSLARYEVHFIKSLADGRFIMNIDQFDSAAIEKIFMQENPVPQQYIGVQMYG